MIDNSVIKDYAGDCVLGGGQWFFDFDIEAIVGNLRRVVVVVDVIVEGYDDCGSFDE